MVQKTSVHIKLLLAFFIFLPSTTLLGAGSDLKDMFGAELPVIRNAADRNKCTGDLFYILLAIRKAENGRSGREFGIMHPKANNLDSQAGWCAATVVKNYHRWIKSGKKQGYIQFLGNRYAPIGVRNDPKGLNKHWVKNVTFWYRKLKGLK